MGPAGLPGPPGVKVSSLHYQNFSVQQVDFCLFVYQTHKTFCFLQGNQGEAGVGVQV